MNIEQAYNKWANIYDSNDNKTRDLEAKALRATLTAIAFESCIELGCGTGKNTVWLAKKTKRLFSIDLSKQMLAKAKEKITAPHVTFMQADMLKEWNFTNEKFQLAIFSLVLEHIENLELIFEKLKHKVVSGGYVYIGELHPFKQYGGSKARFETAEGTEILTCFTHHFSDFIKPALKHGFTLISVNEYFDDNNRTNPPRILTLVLQKAIA